MIKAILFFSTSISLWFMCVPAFSDNLHPSCPSTRVSPDLQAPWLEDKDSNHCSISEPIHDNDIHNRTKHQASNVERHIISTTPKHFYSEKKSFPHKSFSLMKDNSVEEVKSQLLPQIVTYHTQEKPGSIIIDSKNFFLYLVLKENKAKRYGVGVGKPGFEWAGIHKITNKKAWPAWMPPLAMRQREKKRGYILPVSVPGGENNPLGARALYLGSTLYRIHGTNAPLTIGHAVSSGCIRMLNQDVIDLYDHVRIGTKVTVI